MTTNTLTKTVTDPENYDWRNVFAYASGAPESGDCGTPEAAAPGMKVDTTPFSRDDVREIHGAVEGENDGPPWVVWGQLKDGRWFSIKAGCDYTGWG